MLELASDDSDSTKKSIYSGSSIALLTQHGKEKVIAPVLAAAVECQVMLVSGFDTDQLGTFTRDIPRLGSQLEAARKKARMGMELAGASLGIASEGSFGPDPYTGMFLWNVEMIVWIDDTLGIEVVGIASGKASLFHQLTTSWEEAEKFAYKAGFPEHGLVVRPQHQDDARIRKGITDWETLHEAFQWACSEAENGSAFLENDVRAHMNPTRMEVIAEAARDLAHKLNALCPSCSSPGFQMADHIFGLPCENCGIPTQEARADIHRCVRCSYEVTVPSLEKKAPAGRCGFCNP
ncbi:DUF6671 family protein [Sulfuriferula nivalis]|uniref:DUF6671 domain-containing protein n=1 Tax=Sulfuriferula nivalis TaxID=2675298 RepID=A0A809SIQ5_9PROT|nr:DUF6671 family protein [Sulfuriferula nivalis]BBP02300.1 hypothetical protein SFSGTM_30080 [Sulfuriferula nivalis]